MNLNYPIGDFLIKLKNAAMAKNKSFEARSTKQIMAVAEALKKQGYLDGVKKEKTKTTFLLAFRHKRPYLTDLKLVSKPGLRIYTDVWELSKRRKPSILLISTPKGIVSSKEAIKLGVGGEVIVEIL
jgi:small subunit ribosomal protein S8